VPPLRDDAIVLRTFPLGETSLIASLLTRREGRARVVAKGARKPGSPLARSLQSGTLLEAVYYPKPAGRLGLLKEVTLRRSSLTLAGTMEGLALLLAAMELVEGIEARIEGLFEDLEEYQQVLGEPMDLDARMVIFLGLERRLLERLGVAPDLTRCASCGRGPRGEVLHYRVAEGTVACGPCGPGEGPSVELPRPARDALLDLRTRALEEAGRMRLSRESIRSMGLLLHRHLGYHVEGYRLPESLRLLRTYRGIFGEDRTGESKPNVRRG
jgi:DNA repair protein RecO (recombination protein O)